MFMQFMVGLTTLYVYLVVERQKIESHQIWGYLSFDNFVFLMTEY